VSTLKNIQNVLRLGEEQTIRAAMNCKDRADESASPERERAKDRTVQTIAGLTTGLKVS
jgi:hypothetical protein